MAILHNTAFRIARTFREVLGVPHLCYELSPFKRQHMKIAPPDERRRAVGRVIWPIRVKLMLRNADMPLRKAPYQSIPSTRLTGVILPFTYDVPLTGHAVTIGASPVNPNG